MQKMGLVQTDMATSGLINTRPRTALLHSDQATEQLNNALRQLQKEKAANGMKEQADYIESKVPKPKGF